MPRPELRLRKEAFGFTLAFKDGHIGFYSHEAGPLLLQGCTRDDLEQARLATLPVTDNFRLTAPLIVWFEITRSCNLPCKHCYVEAGKPREGELSTPEIFDILEQLQQQGVFALVLVGGEPMRHPDFLEILHRAHELGFVLSIATNGTYITQEIIDAIPREECVVSVSLDGTSFQKEFRVKTDYEEVRDRMLLLKENGIPAAVMTVMTDRNVEELEDIYAFARENDFFFGTTPFSPIGRGRFFPQYLPTLETVEPASQLWLKESLMEKEQYARNGLCVSKFLHECYVLSQAMRREFCGSALAYIQADGAVYPCSICSSSHKYPAGNLREQPFMKIWESGFDQIRSITFNDFKGCTSCELSKDPFFCTSRCPVMSEIYTGDPLECGATPYLKASLKRKTALAAEHLLSVEGSSE